MTTSTSTSVTTSASGAAQISGLSSGIDTVGLVDNFMKLEGRTQALLKIRSNKAQAQTQVLQSLNAKLTSLGTSAATLAKGTSFSAVSASSSSTYLSTTVTGTPAPGSLAVKVTSTAAAQSAEFVGAGGQSYWDAGVGGSYTGPYSMKLTANGKVTTIAPDDYSAVKVAAAINASNAGVSATVVTDANGKDNLFLTAATGDYSGVVADGTTTPPKAPGFKLQLATSGTTASPTYAAEESRGTKSGGDTLTLTDAQDAAITVNGISKTSKSNTFTDVVAGLSVTISNVIPSTALGVDNTVRTTRDTSATASAVSGVVSQIAAILSDISFHTTAPPSGVDASGTNGGLFVGDSLLRSTGQALMQTVTGSVANALAPGQSVTDAGITTDKTGAVSVDSAKLTAFLNANPAVAQAVLKGFGTAVKTVTDQATATTTGTFTQSIASMTSATSSFTKQIADWDDRLALRRATLTAQFTAMETALSRLKAQSDSLTQSLKQLTKD